MMTPDPFTHIRRCNPPSNYERGSAWRSEPPELRREKMNGGVVALIQGIVDPELSELPIPPGHVSFSGDGRSLSDRRQQSAVGAREKGWELQ